MKKSLIALLLISMILPLLGTCSFASPASQLSEITESTSASASEELQLYDASSLPSAVTLVGSVHLPPIDDQGAVGCCASNSIAYTQFTNAVSRYLHNEYPGIDWNPSANVSSNIFSPKFTYTLSGSGTAWVYDALVSHGCQTLDLSSFYKYYGGSRYYTTSGVLHKPSVSWDITGEMGFNALSYRLTNYEQIWVTGGDYVSSTTPKVNGETNVMFTTSTAGKNLVAKIKDALNRGNAVVTGGYPARWDYTTLNGGGTYGKVGQQVIVSASGNDAGGHQVTIVGYDDNITAKYNGVTLKGGFLVSNSWGKGWCNDGYVWIMYDAINTVSEHAGLAGYPSDRTWALDQFCFIYWDRDIAITRPEIMLKVDVNVANREGPYLKLTMKDKETGSISENIPAVFYYGTNICAHPNYEQFDYAADSSKYLTFSGNINGAAETATMYFSYDQLIRSIPEGKSINDYTFGVKFGANRNATVNYSSISLVNSSGETISTYNGSTVSVTSTGIGNLVMNNNVEFLDYTEFKVDLPQQDGCFISCKDTSVRYGDSFSFTLNTISGYSDQNATVKVNGKVITPENGRYTIEKVIENLIITVEGVVKSTDKKVYIRYFSNGVLYAEQSYLPGQTITLSTAPIKTGYTFKGWQSDIYQSIAISADQSIPATMPSASINAFAEFETNKKVVTNLTGGRYGSGMENWSDQTQLLFTVAGSTKVTDIWNNRNNYIFELNYSWTENGKTKTASQILAPTTNYPFSDSNHLFRFEICNTVEPFIPKVNTTYYIDLNVIGETEIYRIKGTSAGYVLSVAPIYNDTCKNMTVKHFFTDGNDFEYWSENTYMTLGFNEVDESFFNPSNNVLLYVTSSDGTTAKYSYTPSKSTSFYKFSETSGLLRFPVLDFGFVPEYGKTYSILFEVYQGNTKCYSGTLSDVSCKLEYAIEWVVDGVSYSQTAPIGEIPEFSGDVSVGGSLSFLTWKAIPKHAFSPAKYVAVYNEITVGWVEADGALKYIKPDGSYATGLTEINGKTYYFSANGALFTGETIFVNGKIYTLDDEHALANDGIFVIGGQKYYYKNGNMLKGWITSPDGKTYYAVSSSGVLIDYSKIIGGKYYIWNDQTGLVLANGFVHDGTGYKCYENGYNVIGWRHTDGSGPRVTNGISEQYSSSPDNLYYFLSTSGYMVTDETYTLGGYKREFNSDHTVKPLNGLQTKAGELYYYVNGVIQTGWHTIDGVTYYFRASDNVYGRAATKWMYIGNKIYYFYASTSATPYALKTSGTIGGISYTYSSEGYIVYNGFVNCDYANEANSNTAENIGKLNNTTRYYVNGEMKTGWQDINGNRYYFYAIGSSMGSGYMCVESRTIGGQWYNFAEDGACIEESWSFDSNTGTLTISGSKTSNYRTREAYRPWAEYMDQIRIVVFTDGMTEIGSSLLTNAKQLEKIYLPSSVKKIGMDAFAYCGAVSEVYLPNSITTASQGVFYSTTVSTLYTDFKDLAAVEAVFSKAHYNNSIYSNIGKVVNYTFVNGEYPAL